MLRCGFLVSILVFELVLSFGEPSEPCSVKFGWALFGEVRQTAVHLCMWNHYIKPSLTWCFQVCLTLEITEPFKSDILPAFKTTSLPYRKCLFYYFLGQGLNVFLCKKTFLHSCFNILNYSVNILILVLWFFLFLIISRLCSPSVNCMFERLMSWFLKQTCTTVA